MTVTLIETDAIDDRYISQLEALAHTRPEAAEVLLKRLLAPAIPRVEAVKILCELRDADKATIDAGLWLHPTVEQREGFSYLAGDETLPGEIRVLGRVVLKLADKVYWEPSHALGLRCSIWQATVALKETQKGEQR